MAGFGHQLIEVGLALFLALSSPGTNTPNLFTIQELPEAGPLSVGVCYSRPYMVRRLSSQYGENPIAKALAKNNQILVEIWVNKKSLTWSITITDTFGKSCLVLSGDHYLGEPPSEAADRSPLPWLR